MSINSAKTTSLQLVAEVNLFRSQDGNKSEIRHDTLLAIIRDEFLEEIGIQELLETPYIHPQNKQIYPMFELTISQATSVLARESRFVRKAIIAKLEASQKPKTQIELIIEGAMVLQQHELRLSNVESKLAEIEQTKLLAISELSYVERSTKEVPEIGIRLKIIQIVRLYVEKTGMPHSNVWKEIYSKMLYAYHFNVNAYKKLHKKELKIDIFERENQLDNLFALVSRELV